MRNICVINHATTHLGLDLATLCRVGGAFLAELNKAWPGTLATLIPSKVILPHTRAIILMDDADQEGALGYHDVTPDGEALGKVFVRTALTNGDAITEVFTHELAEMQVDPDINLVAYDLNGVGYAYEVADAVETETWVCQGYPVTNFVLPAWFAPQSRGGTKLDHLSRLRHPFQLAPGGYISVTQASGWSQVYGSVAAMERPEHRPSSTGRLARRRRRHEEAQKPAHAQYFAAAYGRARHHAPIA